MEIKEKAEEISPVSSSRLLALLLTALLFAAALVSELGPHLLFGAYGWTLIVILLWIH